MITEREREILKLIQEYPMISQAEIAKREGIKRTSVAVHISNLMKKGIILGKGYVLPEYPYVSVVGGVNMDILGSPRNPLIPHDSNPGTVEMSPGGAGRNQAENLCMLGIRTKLITAFGDDGNAEKIRSNCKETGMDTENSIVVPGGRTSIYLSIINKEGELQYGISDMEIMQNLTPEIMKRRMPIINKSCLCLAETNLREETLKYLAENCKVPLFAETVSLAKAGRLREILGKIHLLCANSEDLQALVGFRITNQDKLKESMRFLIKKGIKNVYVIVDPETIGYGDKDNLSLVTSHAVPAGNLTGIRDSFSAALAWSFLNGLSMRDSAVAALSASHICRGSRHAVNETLNEDNLLSLMKEEQAEGLYGFGEL